jgi:antitoxin CptB
MTVEKPSIEDIQILRKRLVYRSWHRGTREMDLLLGSFADKHVPDFTPADLQVYQALLEQNDPDLYNWITGQAEPPANIESDVFIKLRNHRFKAS